MTRRGIAAAIATVAATACAAPKIRPLTGVVPANAVLPAFTLPPGERRVTFQWEMEENEGMLIRGDGVARLAAPDSARVDLFVGGGWGGASAMLIGDSTRTPPGARMVDLIPPAPLLWAALGRLAVPALPDTTIRVSGDTLRAEIGKPVRWRVMSVGTELLRVERVHNDRIVEFVERDPASKHVRYELAAQRTLKLMLQQEQPAAFNASIWQY